MQQTDEWYAARVGKVTASRAGAILGLSPYQTYGDVMREMVREHHGAGKEFLGNIATQWGNDHEQLALSEIEEARGVFLEHCGLIVHPEHSWLAATPDGLAGDAVVEVKCPFNQKHVNLVMRPDYFAQIQIQMACADKLQGLFVSWTPESTEETLVPYDRKWIYEAIPKLNSFHDAYLTIIESVELSAHFIEDLVQDMSNDEEWTNLAHQYAAFDLAKKDAEKKLAEIKPRLIELANGRKSSGSGIMLYSISGRKTIDYKSATKGQDLSEFTSVCDPSWAVKVTG